MAGTFSRLLYHLVFSTKHRTRFIDPNVRTELYPYIEGIVRNLRGWLRESQEGVVRSYIQNQEKHHRRATFEEELTAMLRKHRIEFDPAYVFD